MLIKTQTKTLEIILETFVYVLNEETREGFFKEWEDLQENERKYYTDIYQKTMDILSY